MSQENVEIVKRAINSMNQRDLDGVMRVTDPEIEVDWSRSRGLERGIYHGYQAVRDFWSTFLEMFDPFIFLPEEFIECGEHVVVPNRTTFRGRDGIEVEARYVAVATLRNGRIVAWRLYQGRDEALKAVGLAEYAMSENLDLVRSICAEWEQGRYGSVEWAHPDGEFVIEDIPGSGSSKGVADGVAAWREFLEAWEGHQIEVDEYRELDVDRVLVLGAFRARGKESGVDLEQLRTTGANVFHLRDGKVIKLVIYFDREHALADLGLEE